MFSCLDTSIVSTALMSLSVEFQNYQDTPWTVLGYLLTYMSEWGGEKRITLLVTEDADFPACL